MEHRGFSKEKLEEIRKTRFLHATPIIFSRKDAIKALENNDMAEAINAEMERIQKRCTEDTEMSVVVEMAKNYVDSITPHEVKELDGKWKCTACGIGFGHRFEFDFCPWCGKRMKW